MIFFVLIVIGNLKVNQTQMKILIALVKYDEILDQLETIKNA
jgi:hypothetical protein